MDRVLISDVIYGKDKDKEDSSIKKIECSDKKFESMLIKLINRITQECQ